MKPYHFVPEMRPIGSLNPSNVLHLHDVSQLGLFVKGMYPWNLSDISK